MQRPQLKLIVHKEPEPEPKHTHELHICIGKSTYVVPCKEYNEDSKECEGGYVSHKLGANSVMLFASRMSSSDKLPVDIDIQIARQPSSDKSPVDIAIKIAIQPSSQTKNEIHAVETLGDHQNIIRTIAHAPVAKESSHLRLLSQYIPLIKEKIENVKNPDWSVHMFVMEKMDGTDLLQRLVVNDELENSIKYDIFLAILQGVKHMHDNKIVHRDLKPENIMISSDIQQIKIIDFGTSMKAGSTRVPDTQMYMAPEQWEQKFVTKARAGPGRPDRHGRRRRRHRRGRRPTGRRPRAATGRRA